MSNESQKVEAYDVDADMGPLPVAPTFEAAIFDDGRCPRTKMSICPATYREFLNRCTKDAFHPSGCSFLTKAQPTGPVQQTLFRR